MEYDMRPFIAMSHDFADYLNERRRELDIQMGMSRIELYDGDNYDKINAMKEDFCRLRGVNSVEVNAKWALGQGITEYAIKYLQFVPKKIGVKKPA